MSKRNGENGAPSVVAHSLPRNLTQRTIQQHLPRPREIVRSDVLPRLGNEILNELLDSAIIRQGNQRLAITLDGYVVRPLKFAGGDIGRLAVCGTINNLAVMGAKPLGLALGLILTEDLDRMLLDEVLDSITVATRQAGVRVIAGDTKLVEPAQAPGMYITTAGVGVVARRIRMHPSHVMPGDVLLLNGPIGAHGLAVLRARAGAASEPEIIASDLTPMNHLIEQVIKRVPGVVFMRDPMRGGIVGVCSDLASRTGWRIQIDEQQIPIDPAARRAAEILGANLLELPSGGVIVFAVRPTNVEQALTVLRKDPLGAQAAVFARVEEIRDGRCELTTASGVRRDLTGSTDESTDRLV